MNDDLNEHATRDGPPGEPLYPAQPSPCTGICRVDPDSGYCVGCYRSLEEICNWLSLETEQRTEVIIRCEERRSRLAAEQEDSASL